MVVIPQGVAFASIAGLPPEYGLYAGMIPAIIGALFGSSWHLVSGPTTAGSIVLFSVLSTRAEPGTAEYVQLALTLTLMVGVIQLSLGLLRLGAIVNFISHSVLVGFTAGAAVLIAASQLRHFLGIDVEAQGRGYQTLLVAAEGIPDTNPAAVAVGVATVVAGLLAQRLLPVIPNMLVALFVGTLAAAGLELLMTDTGLGYVSTVPSAWPPLSMPLGPLESFTTLAPAAVALTLFALTEAVSIARSLAIRSGQNLDSNQEFIGQGLSNVAGSFFSAYVATGSFNRSALNYLSGARTPLAAVMAGGLLMLMVPLVAPYMSLLPKAAMAGVLFLVAWGLIDFHHIRKILRASRAETSVLGTTFFSAILLDLEFAILLGVMTSLFLFLWDAVRPRIYSRVPDPRQKNRSFVTDPSLNECPQIKFLRIDGSLFFGAIHHVQKILAVFERRQPLQTHLVIIATAINRIDVSGAEVPRQGGDRPPRARRAGLPLPGQRVDHAAAPARWLHGRHRRGEPVPQQDGDHRGPRAEGGRRGLPPVQATHLPRVHDAPGRRIGATRRTPAPGRRDNSRNGYGQRRRCRHARWLAGYTGHGVHRGHTGARWTPPPSPDGPASAC